MLKNTEKENVLDSDFSTVVSVLRPSLVIGLSARDREGGANFTHAC